MIGAPYAALMVEGSDIGTVVDPASCPPSLRAPLEELCRASATTGAKALIPHPRLASRWVVVPAQENGR